MTRRPHASTQRPNHPTLLQRIVSAQASIAVIGQGYVGLTLAAAAAEAGFEVVGIDVDGERIEGLAAGRLVVAGVDERRFAAGIASGRLRFTTEASAIGGSDLVFICVPTPLRDGAPDLSFVEIASSTVGEHLRRGSLVVLESTTYPGTTDVLVRGLVGKSGLEVGRDYLLAYSPERIDPGNGEFGIRNTPRVVGGVTPESSQAAVAFYEQLVDKVIPVSSTRAAEAAKLLENTFRHVNIGLVNEMAMLCHEMGIDVWEVIHAASTKPFGYMMFEPGPGVGGHCIPLDPTYLAWQIRRESGRRFGVLEQAQDVNDRMPNYIASRVGELLNDAGKAVNGAKILVLGVTYKPDVADTRESPALKTMQVLYGRGADIRFHDFYVAEVPLNGGSIRSVELEPSLLEADVVVLLTPHRDYDLEAIAERSAVVFDTRNAFGTDRRPNVIPL